MPPLPLTHLSPLVTGSLSWLPKSVSLCVCKWGPPYGLSHSTCEWHRGLSVVLWLPSLSVSISRSIHVAGEGISSFFVVAKVTFRYVYVLILCWQRDCLPVLPVVKCCCEHWRACIFSDYGFLQIYIWPGGELLDYMVVLCLVFQWTPYSAPKWLLLVLLVYIPTDSVKRFPFLHNLFNIYCRHFDDGHSGQCEVMPYCSSDLYFSGNYWCFMCIMAICISSPEKCLFRSSAPILSLLAARHVGSSLIRGQRLAPTLRAQSPSQWPPQGNSAGFVTG